MRQFNKETVLKVLDRLIKNEKWHCKIIISLIILMMKQTEADASVKDQGTYLIKRILKKKLWEQLKSNKQIDLWDHIKKGLVIFFCLNQSKDNYRMLKDYVPSEIREEFSKDLDKGAEYKAFIDTYSRR